MLLYQKLEDILEAELVWLPYYPAVAYCILNQDIQRIAKFSEGKW